MTDLALEPAEDENNRAWSELTEYQTAKTEFEEQDFVVSGWVLAERSPKKSLLWWGRQSVAVTFLAMAFAVVLVFLVCLFVLGYASQFRETISIQHHIGIVIGYFAQSLFIFSAACFFISLLAQNWGSEFPTNLVLNKWGIKFAWRHATSFMTDSLHWSSLQSVGFLSGEGRAIDDLSGGRLRLVFCTKHLEFSQRIEIYRRTAALRAMERWSLCGLFTGAPLSLQIPLDAFTLESDREKIICALNELAPPETKDASFLMLKKGSDAPSYTKFWLDDMQSFKRRREDDLAPGTTLQEERYRVLSRLATGGQAKIYRALEGNKPVILKEFVLPVHGGAEVRQRSFANVKRESELLGSLHHDAIVRLLGNFVEDHRAYLVLEEVEGDTLKKKVEAEGPMSAKEVLSVARQMLCLLQYLHSLSPVVVHRDISPDNLMYDSTGRVKLIDFNVAREMEAGTTRTVVGKHNYMAPEQFKGRACPKSDLYSLGATLYYLYTAREPVALSVSRLPEGTAGAPADAHADANGDAPADANGDAHADANVDSHADAHADSDFENLNRLIGGLTALNLEERLDAQAAIDLVQAQESG